MGRYQDYLNLKHYEDCKYGFINKKGKEVIEPQFDWAGDFVDGMAPVSKNGRYYFIDKSGQPIDDKTYTRLSGFKGDLCWVKKGSKGGFMNKKNEIVLPLEYDNYMYFFDRGSKFQTTNLESELGESLFQNDDGFFVVSKSDDEWGIVNEDNKVLTEFIYSDIGIPKEGFVEIEKRSGKGLGRYIRGRIMEVVPCKFDYIYHAYFSQCMLLYMHFSK